MAFTVVVPAKSNAARLLSALQPQIRQAFWKHVSNLGPASDSRPGDLPDSSTRGQIYRFKLQVLDITTYFTVFFRFADTQDESTLQVLDMHVESI